MMRAAADNKVLLMEAFMYRFHPQWRRIEEIISGGDIGAVRFIRSSFAFAMSDFSDIRFVPEMAGGALMDVGCYCVNFSRYVASLAGAGDKPQAVYAAANFHNGDGVDETLVGTLRFGNGVLAQFVCSLRMPGGAMAEIVGETGKIEVLNPWFGGNLVVTANGETRTEEVPAADNYVAEVDHFAQCAQEGTPLSLPPEDARANLAVIEALLQSARSGQEVPL